MLGLQQQSTGLPPPAYSVSNTSGLQIGTGGLQLGGASSGGLKLGGELCTCV